jgi:hypothetical protein
MTIRPIRLRKKNLSPEFIAEARLARCIVDETEKTITIKPSLSPQQKYMLESGQLTRRQVIKNIHMFLH